MTINPPKTSTALNIQLLGTFSISQGKETFTLPASNTARALLAFLIYNRQHAHTRSLLAGVFWPESVELRARRSLSQAIWQIRKHFPDLIETVDNLVRLPAGLHIKVDTEEFQRLCRKCLDASAPAPDLLPQLRQAIRLYQGDLLEGIYDDWIFVQRENLREIYQQVLEQLIGLEKTAGRYNQALVAALQLTNIDPLREVAHREVMRLYFLLGRPKAAIKQYETCRRTLHTELNLAPEATTSNLATEIARQSNLETPHLPMVPPPAEAIGLDRSKATLIPLVGRNQTRARLLQKIEPVFDGRGGIILVEGEAGVGKTRLIQELGRDAKWRGAQVLWGHGHELEATPPFGPLLDALNSGLSSLRVEQLTQFIAKKQLKILVPLLNNLADHLPDLAIENLQAPHQERTRLLEALIHLLGAWAQITPVLLILEDLHWFDDDSLSLLPELCQQLDQIGVFIVGSYRGEDARAYPALWDKLQQIDRVGLHDRILLPRLDAKASGELIRRSLGLDQAAPIFEKRVYAQTDGNPLFVLETLRALQDEGLLSQDKTGKWNTPWDNITDDYAELPLPPAVERVIDRRLARLSPNIRSVLDTVAILGNEFEFSILKIVSEQSPIMPTVTNCAFHKHKKGAICDREGYTSLLGALRSLVHRQFLTETDEGYHFCHEKIRQVAYQSIHPDQRKQKHKRIGELLEGNFPHRVSSLAFHFYNGETWEKARHYYLLAGDQARLAYATSEAINCYDLAISSWQRQQPTDNHAGLRLFQKRGRIYQNTGRFDLAKKDFETAFKFSEQLEDKPNQMKITNHLSYLQFQRGDFKKASLFAQKALKLASETDFSIEIAIGLLNNANAVRNLGRYQQAIDLYKQASTIFKKHDDQPRLADCLNRMGAALEHTGNYVEALSSMEDSLVIRRKLDDKMGISYSLINMAGLYHAQGQFTLTRQASREALEIAAAINDPYGQDAALQFLGLAALELEGPEQAIPYFTESLKIGREIGDQALETDVLAGMGMVYLLMNALEKAKETLEKALQLASISVERDTLSHIYNHLAQTSLFNKKFVEALEYANIALQKAQEIREPYRVAQAHRTLGEVSSQSESRKTDAEPTFHFKESIRILQEIGAEAEQARSMVSYGLFLQASGQSQKCAKLISDAKIIFQKLEMKPAFSRLENELSNNLAPGQIKVLLPHANAPTGRPLRDEEWVNVTWTTNKLEDDAIQGKTTRRQHRIRRMLEEAHAQGAAPTVKNLASSLDVSLATVKRDLAALRKAGFSVQTRGSRDTSQK